MLYCSRSPKSERMMGEMETPSKRMGDFQLLLLQAAAGQDGFF